MRHKTNFLFLFLMISITEAQRLQRDQTNHREINIIDAEVDFGTNATTLVLLMGSDSKPVYAVLISCKYSIICDNCSETRHF